MDSITKKLKKIRADAKRRSKQKQEEEKKKIDNGKQKRLF